VLNAIPSSKMQCSCLGISQALGKIDYRYWIWEVEVLVLQTPEVAASLKIRSRKVQVVKVMRQLSAL